MAKFILKLCKIAKMLTHIYSVADPDPVSGALLTLDPGWKKIWIRDRELRNSF
jgi:hypothetical protein